MTDDLVSRWERLLASDTTTRMFSVRVVAMREALDHIVALTAERDRAYRMRDVAVEAAYLFVKKLTEAEADNARLREALADAAVALDAAGMELSEFANTLSREPSAACEAYEAAIDARAALNTGKADT